MHTHVLNSYNGCREILSHCLIKWFKSFRLLLRNIMENMHVTEYIQWEPSVFECFQKKNAKPSLAKTCDFILFQWHIKRHKRGQFLIFKKDRKNTRNQQSISVFVSSIFWHQRNYIARARWSPCSWFCGI